MDCKNVKICFNKYPIPICTTLFLFFISYMFFPSLATFLIYSSPLVVISFLVHRILLGIDARHKIKQQVEENDRRRKFAKSRRSFKSIYGDRRHLVRRNVREKTDNYSNDAVLSKSFHDLLVQEEKPKEIREVNFESNVRRGECSSSKDEMEGSSMSFSEDDDDEPQDKAVRWTEDDQKNVMDLGLLETERNKRLESLIQKRRSRKNLGFQERENGQVSAIKIAKMNPFLEGNSHPPNTPGSAPSSLLSRRNPFDLPYDPHEEKPDLTGDNFHEEFAVVHHKEPIFCRHQSFSLGVFSHPRDKHEISFYKDHKPFTGLGTSTFGNSISYSHPKDGGSAERVVGVIHEEDGTERKPKDNDVHLDFQRSTDLYDCSPLTMLEERNADINFFYGDNNQVRHAPSNSILSDLQVEVSEDRGSSFDDLDVEKDKESWLDSSYTSAGGVEVVKDNTNPAIISTDQSAKSTREVDRTAPDQETQDKQCVSEGEPQSSTHVMDNKPRSLNSDTVQSNHLHESSGASHGSVGQAAPEVASSSIISVLQPYNFAKEVQQSDNRAREADSSSQLLPDRQTASENGMRQINNSGENPINDRDPEKLQDQHHH